jgi:hypothetical protein
MPLPHHPLVTAAICIGCLIGTAATFFSVGHQSRTDQTSPPAPPGRRMSRRLSSAVVFTSPREEQPGVCARVTKRISVMLLVLGYFVYPGANAIFFQTFNCQSIDGKRYLRKDLSIDCSDPAHQFSSILAVFMVAIFSVGLPMLYLSLLIPHRKGFIAHSGRSQAGLKDVRDLRFFFMVRLKKGGALVLNLFLRLSRCVPLIGTYPHRITNQSSGTGRCLNA